MALILRPYWIFHSRRPARLTVASSGELYCASREWRYCVIRLVFAPSMECPYVIPTGALLLIKGAQKEL